MQNALHFQEELAARSEMGHGEDHGTPSSLASTWVLGEQPEFLPEDWVGFLCVGLLGFVVLNSQACKFSSFCGIEIPSGPSCRQWHCCGYGH